MGWGHAIAEHDDTCYDGMWANGRVWTWEEDLLPGYEVGKLGHNSNHSVIARVRNLDAEGEPVGEWHGALLLPIYLVQPKILRETLEKDLQAVETGEFGRSTLEIAQWENCFVPSGKWSSDLKAEFVEKDVDRFYIRLSKEISEEKPVIELRTRKKIGSELDDFTELELETDPNDSDWWRTKPQMLVARELDDQFDGKGAGADDEKNDKTHLAELLGEIELKLSFGNRVEAKLRKRVPDKDVTIKHLPYRAVTLGDHSGNPLYDIGAVTKYLKEEVPIHFSQINIVPVMMGNIEVLPAPKQVSYANGISGANRFGSSVWAKHGETNYIRDADTNRGNSMITIYIVPWIISQSFEDDKEEDEPWKEGYSTAYPAKNDVFLAAEHILGGHKQFTPGQIQTIVLPHESIHLLDRRLTYPLSFNEWDQNHYEGPNWRVNLMRDGASAPKRTTPSLGEVELSWRIFENQEVEIHKTGIQTTKEYNWRGC